MFNYYYWIWKFGEKYSPRIFFFLKMMKIQWVMSYWIIWHCDVTNFEWYITPSIFNIFENKKIGMQYFSPNSQSHWKIRLCDVTPNFWLLYNSLNYQCISKYKNRYRIFSTQFSYSILTSENFRDIYIHSIVLYS